MTTTTPGKIPTSEEVRQFHRDAEEGDASAQYNLGFLYAYGKGVPQDYDKAVEWTNKASDQRHAGAQYGLAYMYVHGIGLKRDYAKAIKLYKKAANQCHEKARFWLGFMFANGQGVPRDYVVAHGWLNLAAEQGIENAKKLKATIETQMTAEQIDNAQKWVVEYNRQYDAWLVGDDPHDPFAADRYDNGEDYNEDSVGWTMEDTVEMFNEGDKDGWY